MGQGAYTQTQKQPSIGKRKAGNMTEDVLHEVAAGSAIGQLSTQLKTKFERLHLTFEKLHMAVEMKQLK